MNVRTATSSPTNLLAHLAWRTDLHARPAFAVGEASLSYGDLLDLVRAIAERLLDFGVAPGDRVLLLLPNCVEHVAALLAVASVCGIAVPLDPDSGAARLAHVIDETDPRLCLVLEGADAPPRVQCVTCRVDLSAPSVRFSPAPRAHRRSSAALPPVDPDEIALLRYSSGTTGVPKGVPLTHGQILWTASTLATIYGLDAGHRDYVVSPMGHSGSWQRVAMTLANGGGVVLAQGLVSLAAILEDIESFAVTGFYMPPPLMRMLLKASPDRVRRALAGCRSIESGSASLSAEELRHLMDLAPAARVFFHYGLTECSRAVILDARSHPDKLETVGRPTTGVELLLRGDDGRPAGPGQSGQILLRGPQLATSYWNRPELTKESYIDGWFATGDYGQLDGDGFLTFLGRRDDLINSAAYSFFPAEVELELGPVDGAAQYVVAGMPDPSGVVGQVPWAFVVPAEPEAWSPRDFLAVARKRLPPHMVPRMAVPVSSLPLTSSGKPDRRRTVELHGSQGGTQHDEK